MDILDLATTAFSSTDFVIPIALIGEAALSVLKQMTASTPSSIAAVKTFSVPMTFYFDCFHWEEFTRWYLL